VVVIEKEEMKSLLPHRGSMLLLSRIRDYNIQERNLEAEYDIVEDCILYDPLLGGFPGWVGFEFMAQAISVLSGLAGRQKGEKPKLGFILSVSSMNISMPVLKAGKTIMIRVEEDCHLDMVYTFRGGIFLDNERAAEAKLTVVDADEDLLENMIKEPGQN
jgi:predicted hotdog family 3-hydroxylacyl-ACP dehydratase